MINAREVEFRQKSGDRVDVELPVIWIGAVNGILSGSTSGIESRIKAEVKQIIDQSPYLKK